MASILSPKNVGKLIIADALAAETTNSEFVASAALGEVTVISANGSAVAANKPFKLINKRDEGLTGINISDTIDPYQIDYIKVSDYVAESAKVIEVDGFTGTPISNATYRVSIRKFDHIQSPENFRHVHGFAVTPYNSTMTYSEIQAELVANLNASLRRENALKEMEASVSGTKIVITGKVQPFTLGKDEGMPVNFEVEVSVKDNSPATLAEAGTSYNILTVTTTQQLSWGVGTGKQVALAEYALKGYENADYGRAVSFPNNFNVSYLSNPAGKYKTLVIGFHKDREGTNVERQFKELTLVSEDVTVINGVKALIGITTSNLHIPADL